MPGGKERFLPILKAVKDGKFNEKMEEINRLRQAFDPEINRLVNERGKGTINDDSWNPSWINSCRIIVNTNHPAPCVSILF